MQQDQRDWSPEIGKVARVKADAPGIFKQYAGVETEIKGIYWERRQVSVEINRQALIMDFRYFENPPSDEVEAAGETTELLLRISRLCGALKKTMTTEGIRGFGDGGHWRADIEGGKLKIWEV